MKMLVLLLATAGAIVQEPRVTRVWTLRLHAEECDSKIDGMLVFFDDSIAIRSTRKDHAFQWAVDVSRPMPLVEALCEMSRRRRHVRILAGAGLDLWLTPYGAALSDPGPAPKWHDQVVAPAEWVERYLAWRDHHQAPAENFEKRFELLAHRRDSSSDVRFVIAGPKCSDGDLE